MKLHIFIQAIQIMLYKKVHGWTSAFEFRAVFIALLCIALNLFSSAQDEVPDLEDAEKRTGIILDILDAGRYGDKSLILQENGQTNATRSILDIQLRSFEVWLGKKQLFQLTMQHPFLD